MADEHPDPRTTLTPCECRLIKQTWKEFNAEEEDFMHIFISFFSKSPESMQLFPHFHGNAITLLPDQPEFRAHAWAVGYQLAALVEYSDDSTLFEALVRKNAMSHAGRHGVRPEHFDVMVGAVIETIAKKAGKAMTPAAITAWEKLTACIGKITASVYEEEQVGSKPPSPDDTAKAVGPGGSGAGANAAASKGSVPKHSSAANTGSSSGAMEEGAVVCGTATPVQALAAVPKLDKPSPTEVRSKEDNLPAAFSAVHTLADGPLAAPPPAISRRAPSAEGDSEAGP